MIPDLDQNDTIPVFAQPTSFIVGAATVPSMVVRCDDVQLRALEMTGRADLFDVLWVHGDSGTAQRHGVAYFGGTAGLCLTQNPGARPLFQWRAGGHSGRLSQTDHCT